MQQQTGAYAAVLQETIAGMRVVQAFAAEDREFENFQRANWAVREKSLEANRIAALRQPMIIFCMQLAASSCVLAYGGHLVIGGEMTLGTLLAFAQYNGQLLGADPASVGVLLNTLQPRRRRRRAHLRDPRRDLGGRREARRRRRWPTSRATSRYEDVSFGYGKAITVLEDVNIDAQPGQIVALLGPDRQRQDDRRQPAAALLRRHRRPRSRSTATTSAT